MNLFCHAEMTKPGKANWNLRNHCENFFENAKQTGKCETECQGTYMCWDQLRSNFEQFRDHLRSWDHFR